MKKNYLLAVALAIMTMASCSDNDFVGDQGALKGAGEGAISFTSVSNAMTRANSTGGDAAALLNSNFVFAGTKGTSPTTFVFDQYNANYVTNTAGTTESNSNGWEYVGYTAASTSTLEDPKEQSIKYWDYSTTQYDFAAYSLGLGADLDDNGSTPNTFATATAIAAGTKSYTLTGKAKELAACYISDLVTAYNQSSVGDYGKPVQFSFRSLGAKIRLAFFETIPGYSVKDVKFYTASDASLATDGTELDPTLFAASSVLPIGEGTMTITFPTTGFDKRPGEASADTDYNKAHIAFSEKTSSDLSTTLVLEDLANYASAEKREASGNYLGRASNAATYAGGLESGAGKYYTILPYETGANLTLRIKYTLVSTDGSGETIDVDKATAVIPANLAKWSPNYAYTYIFKISDMTNGQTGFGPDGTTPVYGLTPITLDAVVVDNEDGTQETITTVSTPSITTYLLGKVITENDEYVVNGSHPIYIVVNDGSSNKKLYKTTDTSGDPAEYANAKLYTAEVEAGAIQEISEATVDNALSFGVISTTTTDNDTYTVTDAAGKYLKVIDVTSSKLTAKVTKILAEDSPTGNEINIDCATFVPETGKTFVFQYLKNAGAGVPTAATYAAVAPKTLTNGSTYYTYNSSTSLYDSFTATGGEKVVAGGTVYYTLVGENYIRVEYSKLTAGTTYYTSNRGAGKFVAAGTEVIDAENKYFTQTSAGTPGEYQYKIIKIKP